MNKKKDVLIKNAEEYFHSGEEELKKLRNNAAVVLFFKALISLSDLYILQKIGKIPSSHFQRFRILQMEFPEIYSLVDKDFPFYQDSYNSSMSKELAEVIKNDVQFMAEKTKVKL